jgi:hypothetical protein
MYMKYDSLGNSSLPAGWDGRIQRVINQREITFVMVAQDLIVSP